MLKVTSTFFAVTVCIILFSTSLFARNTSPGSITQTQVVQENAERMFKIYPIPGGEPVIVGGVKVPTPEEMAKIPDLRLKKRSLQLPESCNNGDEKFFPDPVVNQGAYGSCAQASGIGHQLTYALNLARDATEPPYPHNYTWNFLNGGVGSGSSFLEGWEIVNESGCPTRSEWGSGISADTKWMTDYDRYYSALKNRYLVYNKVDISTSDGIETVKQWIFDYGDGSPVGGCASFSCMCVPPMYDNPMVQLPSGSPEAGWPVVAAWGYTGGHAMVIVGYHDGIKFDVNKDGEYTNDQDITGDGTVDVADWEIGGWLVANSWGAAWGDKEGFYYMLYRIGNLEVGNAYADTSSSDNATIVNYQAGGLSSNKHCFTLRARLVDDAVNRQVTYKVKMNYTQRDQISISSGVSNNTSDNTSEFSHRHIIFNYQGGAHAMQGSNAGSDMEMALDVKPLLNNVDKKEAKYFLTIDSKGAGSGKVESFSLMDYRGPDPVQKDCDQTDVTINAGTTVLSIVYESAMDPLTITTASLPPAKKGDAYNQTLAASGGKSPYAWEMLKNVYYEVDNTNSFPSITDAASPNDTDDGLAEVDLDFDFPFYGETVKKIHIATDGHILFDPAFVYVRSAKALMATKCIAVLGADLVITSTDGLYFKGESDKATIRWKTKNMWSETGLIAVDLDFAAVIYPSGKIEYYYGTNMSGDVSGMAIGSSGGKGAYVSYDYGTLADIPSGHKFGLVPEKELAGMAMANDGKFTGTPTDDNGDYRVSFAVTDALEIRKVKSFTFNIGNTAIGALPLVKLVSQLTITHRSSNAILFSFATFDYAKASLELYTLNGKKVQTLFEGKLKSGNHKVVWNLHDKNSHLSNGIYMCRLSVGKERIVKKVAVFK